MTQHVFGSAVQRPEVKALVLHINSGAARSGNDVSQAPWASGPSGTNEGVDPDVLAKALRLHADLVPRYAFRLTGNVHDAEDLAQDVFVRVLRALPRFDPDLGSMEGWLSRITLNLFRDKLRKDRLREPGRFFGAEEPACTRPGPAEVALAGRLDPDLEAALESLPPAMLETVLLADVAGLSHREIAATTGVARGTVASRLCRAHARLQAQLAPHRVQQAHQFRHVA
jgi:RNA polymerase sigma factor (sigma-70 family)